MTGKNSIFINTKEIAADLEISVQTFRTSLPRLIERDGFPLPSPHCLKPKVWRRDAFQRWLDSQCGTAADLQGAAPGQPPASNVHLLNHARTA